MICGHVDTDRSPAEITDRLKLVMSGGNFRITAESANRIEFDHGSFMTETAYVIPKSGCFIIEPVGDRQRVSYEVSIHPAAKGWLLFVATVFCWLIFPPLLIHRALRIDPRRLMDNVLQAI